MRKTAVITGGTGNLGHAVVARFVEIGFDVHLSAIDEEDKNRYDGTGAIAAANLADLDSTKSWATEIPAPVHALVLMAGGFSMNTLLDLGRGDFDNMFDTNAKTAFNCLSAFAGKLQRGSSAVLVGSQAYAGAAGMSLYAASKAAVVSLSKSAALEFKPQGVRVNAILPDIIDTPANRKSMPNADFDKWQKPEEIAEVIAFLCSDGGSIISGNTIELGRV
ncbi:MAG: SDR family oxidoreductase [Armatimonadetes bacterium]|nr:SDR family oxidoreductase [Armatimonadota bacterium]